jgi:pimeloyl-ACP methyl ester carboxylesterase
MGSVAPEGHHRLATRVREPRGLGEGPPRMTPAVRRAFAEVPDGIVHYAEAGAGAPVLLLHQTPRSWDEYREVLPLLGGRFRAIAMDTLGFGDSSRPSWPLTIERLARVCSDLLDVLGIERTAVVGHHTGGVIALELAASKPERVERLVLSSTPLVDEEFRRSRAETGPVVDEVESSDDGSHAAELWRRRMRFYPPGRRDLMTRFLVDALRAGEFASGGHRAVAAYAMEKRLPLVRCPVLVVGGTADPFAHPHLRPLAERLPGSRIVEIEGGMVPLPDQLPSQFAAAVLAFLDA